VAVKTIELVLGSDTIESLLGGTAFVHTEGNITVKITAAKAIEAAQEAPSVPEPKVTPNEPRGIARRERPSDRARLSDSIDSA